MVMLAFAFFRSIGVCAMLKSPQITAWLPPDAAMSCDEMFQDFGATYVEQGRIATPDDLATVDDVCRIKGRAGVGLLTHRPVERTRIGLGPFMLGERVPARGKRVTVEASAPNAAIPLHPDPPSCGTHAHRTARAQRRRGFGTLGRS